jgi:hypothetical protein
MESATQDEINAEKLRKCSCPGAVRSINTYNAVLYCSVCFPSPTPRVIECLQNVENAELAYRKAIKLAFSFHAFNQLQIAYAKLAAAVRNSQPI